MRNLEEIAAKLGQIDVYLLDHLLKNNYSKSARFLDAGCGHGRNVSMLLSMSYDVHGIDVDPAKIDYCIESKLASSQRFGIADLVDIPFGDSAFDLVISSAVFHFCKSKEHFEEMFREHVRVMKPGGKFFIRMTTKFGMIEDQLTSVGNGRFILPDETERFLLTYQLLYEMLRKYNVALCEPVKTVNVHEMRAMGVIVLHKKNEK